MKKYYLAISAVLLVGMLIAYSFRSVDPLTATTDAPPAPATTRPDNAPSYPSLNAAVKAARHNIQYVDGNQLKGYPGGGYVAQNKANDVAAIFTKGGTEIRSGKDEHVSTAHWRLASIGRGDTSSPVVGEPKITTVGARLDYIHRTESGEIREWFDNAPAAMEHGFVVSGQPARVADEWIRLSLAVNGNLTAKADGSGTSLDLSDKNGEVVLSYRDLKVWDANQTPLSARLRTEKDGEIWIEVDDKNAAYPITVDPTFVKSQFLIGNDTASGDQFGDSISVSGNTMVVGARFADPGSVSNRGAAYVFVKNGSRWVQQAKLVANDGAAGDLFGSVAIEGDTIVVGSLNNAGKGAAYVFTRTGTAWTQTKLTASDGSPNDQFGHSVGISGDFIVVGAVGDQVGSEFGSVYVFKKIGGSWVEQQKLFRPTEYFRVGNAIAIDGNTLVIGHFTGAFIYVFNGTQWAFQAELDSNHLVLHVAIDGDTVVLNSAFEPSQPSSSFGMNIFARSGTTWTRTADVPGSYGGGAAIEGDNIYAAPVYYRFVNGSPQARQVLFNENEFNAEPAAVIDHNVLFLARSYSGAEQGVRIMGVPQSTDAPQPSSGSDTVTGDGFGFSVAISGDYAVVGAPFDDFVSSSNQGSAYVFIKDANGWSQRGKLVASDGAPSDNFGISVDINSFLSGGTRTITAIVGASNADPTGLSAAGAVYIYSSTDGVTWSTTRKFVATSPAAGDGFGRSVDYFVDDRPGTQSRWIFVGAPGRDDGATNAGAVYRYSTNSISDPNAWTFEDKLVAADPVSGAQLGFSVVGVYDPNLSSSTGRCAAGAPTKTVNSITNKGSVYLFDRNGAQITELAASGSANERAGISLATYQNRLLVGVPGKTVNGNTNQGQVQQWIFNENGTFSLTTLTAPDGAASDSFGTSVGFANEVAVAGAPGAKINSLTVGAAYVFTRDGTFSFFKKLTNQVPAANDEFGVAVAASENTVLVGADVDDGKGTASFITILTKNGATTPFDFDGDGKTDIGIFRPLTSAEWWINRSSTGQTFALQFGTSSDRITPADYTGDGKTDIAFFRPSSGQWFVLRSEDSSFFALPFGANGDVPVPGDYDADGKADFAVFRPSSSTWFISQSGGAPTRIVQFGVAGDQPVVADYDGDGKSDIAVFRNAGGTAQWWIERSTAGSLALPFGASTDKAVQGDYTGDGKADVAIWRPSTGEWFIVRSEDSSFYGFPFGASTDTPAPGDYDGDGKFDATVFRPSSATWFIARSTAGTQIVQFGASGDRPIANAFVQ